MRLSVHNQTRGQLKRAVVAHNVDVVLNGERQPFVLAADERMGFVKRIVFGADCKAVFSNGRVRTETIHGDVQIALRSDAPAEAVACYAELRDQERKS